MKRNLSIDLIFNLIFLTYEDKRENISGGVIKNENKKNQTF